MPQQNILEVFWSPPVITYEHVSSPLGLCFWLSRSHSTGLYVDLGDSRLQQENAGVLGRRDSWSISLVQASQFLPELLMSELCFCFALMILTWISALLIYFQFSEDDTLLSTEPLSVSLEVPLHPITNSSEHRGLQTMCC